LIKGSASGLANRSWLGIAPTVGLHFRRSNVAFLTKGLSCSDDVIRSRCRGAAQIRRKATFALNRRMPLQWEIGSVRLLRALTN